MACYGTAIKSLTEGIFMQTKQKRRKRAVTLVELIVVIALISIITAALAYNYKGSLNEGKKFKKVQYIERIKNILEIEVAQGETAEAVVKKSKSLITNSPLGGDKVWDAIKELNITIQADSAKNEITVS